MVEVQSSFHVKGMDCSDEVDAVKKTLLALSGVLSVEPNILKAQVAVTHEQRVAREFIISAIETAGLVVEEGPPVVRAPVLNRRTVLVAISGAALCLALLAGWIEGAPPVVEKIAAFAAILFGSVLILPKALRGLRLLKLDMNVLMCVAVLGAIAIGEYVEGAAVVFLFALAELLESFSLERARRSIQSLLNLVPENALRKTDRGFVEVPVSEVGVGERLLVRSGSRIPLDGTVLSGTSAVNQAPITGESLPVERGPGDRVLAGTINGDGSLEIEVTQTHSSTKLAQIVRLIEDAQKQKAPAQRFVDTFAKYYTPSVVLIALAVLMVPPLFLGGAWNVWLYRALVLLVIACPCALVIATPVSIVSGLTAMARRGVLIKGGAGLETIGKIRAIAVDKTGTITQGAPRVLGIYPMNGHKEEEVLAIAASIDSHSPHPLARAVVKHVQEKGVTIPESIGYQAASGRGAEAVLADHIYFVGNHRFAHENAVCTPELERKLEELEAQAQSVVVVGHRPHAGCVGQVMGVLGVGDAVRDDAKSSIEALRRSHIESVVMLSGDNQRTVDAISKQVGIHVAFGDLLPNDKVLRIKELRDRFNHVAMVGDGVNDAPAMATASLGIAMGGTGTDTAIETSDVTLMQDRLGAVAEAIQMGRRTLKIIWFNTGLALATKLLFLGLSITGHSSLWLAIAADAGTTLVVIANALRLLR